MSDSVAAAAAADMSNLGIDLLVNTRKKSISPDAISILSSGSGRSHRSFKYVPEDASNPHDFKAKPRNEWMSANDGDSSDTSSMRSRRRRRQKEKEKEKEKEDVESIGKSQSKEKESADKTDEYWTRRPKNEADALILKRELLYELDRLKAKGVRLPRMYTLETPLDEMQTDYMRIKRDRELDAGVMFQRNILITCVSGLEFMSSTFSPFDCKLDGWSHDVSDKIDNFDDILEELYLKHKGGASFPPEVKLLMALGGSAVLFSIQNRLASSMGGDDRGRRNEGKPSSAGMFSGLGGIGSLIGSIFSGGMGLGKGGGPQQQQQQQQQPHDQQRYQAAAPMRGPTLNVDSVLKNLHHNAFERSNADHNRVEIISTISESDVPDDASMMSGVLPSMLKSADTGRNRRTLDLSDL